MLESLFHESVETPTQVRSCEISKHSKTIFFTEHLRWLLQISYEISYICFIFLKNTLFSYQTVHQSEIQWWKFLFVKYTLSFIRTSKFCLRLAVLNFFFHFWGWNVLNLFFFPRLSAIKTRYFISFILFLSSSAHRQPLGGVLQKTGSATVLKPIKKYLQMSSIFH